LAPPIASAVAGSPPRPLASGPLRVAAVGDLHAVKVRAGPGLRPVFMQIAEQADALILCGDLTNTGLPEEAETLAGDLAGLRIPIAAVLGNHDHHAGRAEEVRATLRRANVTFIDDEPLTVGAVGFAGAKGFGGGFARHMLDAFGEDATKHFVTESVNEALKLEHTLRELTTPRAVVALHYSPIVETVRGESPEIYPFLGSSRLGETIDRFENVEAVFHGHAHHGTPEGRTTAGIPVYNCCVELLMRTRGHPYLIITV
jgi:Icc-related predicted phosphoesterase